MDQRTDDEMKEFIEGIAEDLGYTRKTENKQLWDDILDFMTRKKLLVIGAACFFILLVFFVFLFGNRNPVSSEGMIDIQKRLDHIDDRLAFLEGIENKVAAIGDQGSKLHESISRIERAERGLEDRLDKMNKKLDLVKKDFEGAREKRKVQFDSEKKSTTADKAVYHVVRAGETLYRIAQQHGISVDALCSLNNLNKKQTLSIGQKLLISQGNSR
ncbi:MAG: LysM peptidoglycan-binding domain-containing protein [Deltaproteobacteria bacterium]|nr:LysM peptidoglycan-binding domain-containing protein [Deltaproteobacteria bacterium]